MTNEFIEKFRSFMAESKDRHATDAAKLSVVEVDEDLKLDGVPVKGVYHFHLKANKVTGFADLTINMSVVLKDDPVLESVERLKNEGKL
jgi:hypothetical protein